MSDPNPYKPPQSEEPVPLKKIVKRGLGAFTIAMLTPFAVITSGLFTCAVVDEYHRARQTSPYSMNTVIIVLTPPILTLIGMTCWALRARRNRNTQRLIDSLKRQAK